MPAKSPSTPENTGPQDPVFALNTLAPAGWMSREWMEAMADLGAEITSFVADRIREDVKTQHKILHSTSLEELQHVQADFIQRAFDDYSAETGKLVQMSTEIVDKIRTQAETKTKSEEN